MSSRESEEKVIPIGVVLMVVGMIVVLTAVTILVLLPQRNPSTSQRQPLPPVTVVVTPEPGPEDSESTSVLLPETPLEAETYPAHFVSALEAAQSAIPGQPKRIVIPAIDLDAPVSEVWLSPIESNGETYYQWQVPNKFTAGWHNTSALLGQAGNTVLNGHHNIFGEVFGRLIDLEVGDEITLYDAEDRSFAYVVSQVELLPEQDQPLEVRLENARWMEPTEDERITLVTCWPYTDNTHRLVVVAQPTVAEDSS